MTTERLLHRLRTPLRTTLVFSMVANLALLAPSLFMLQVFDRVLTTRSVETLLVMAVIALFTLGLMGVLEHYRGRTLSAMGLLCERELGPTLIARALRAGPEDPAARDGLQDLARVRAFISGTGVLALLDAPWTLFYLALIFVFHPVLGGLATACVAALVLLAWVNERLTRAPIEALGEANRAAARQIDAAVRQAEPVVALGMVPAVVARWLTASRLGQSRALALSAVSAAVTALSRVARQSVQVLMLGVGAWLVIGERATPGVMLATTIILARALAPLELLVGNWRTVVEARAAFRRLRALLVDGDEAAPKTELPRPRGVLQVEGLQYLPPGAARPVLRGVSFGVEPGQVLAVLGPSGAGKSTLVRALVGAVPATAGTVRLDGAELSAYDPDRLGACIGYLPQDVALLSGTVAENIARLGVPDPASVLRAAERARVHELLLRLPAGYDTPLDGPQGVRLSGGQRQRVGLARALYGEPALVVLDEPDASLDADGERALVEALRGLKAAGMAVVVVSQRRAVLAAADRVLVLRDGLVEHEGPVDSVMPRPTAIAGGAA